MAGEFRRGPAPGLMTVAAGGPEAGGDVIDRGEGRSIVLTLVAADAFGRGAVERTVSRLEVTLSARNQRVASDQRKVRSAVSVGGKEWLPSGLLVTAFAALTELSAVRIPVTTGAERWQRRLEILGMAGFAIDPLMGALEWKSSRGVVEGGGRPGGGDVTHLARRIGLRFGRQAGERPAPCGLGPFARIGGQSDAGDRTEKECASKTHRTPAGTNPRKAP
jgi:hypothetical protein